MTAEGALGRGPSWIGRGGSSLVGEAVSEDSAGGGISLLDDRLADDVPIEYETLKVDVAWASRSSGEASLCDGDEGSRRPELLAIVQAKTGDGVELHGTSWRTR